MPQEMHKVEEEIRKICYKLAPENEILRHELDFHLHGFSVTVIKEYIKMMAEEKPYNPDEVRHG